MADCEEILKLLGESEGMMDEVLQQKSSRIDYKKISKVAAQLTLPLSMLALDIADDGKIDGSFIQKLFHYFLT